MGVTRDVRKEEHKGGVGVPDCPVGPVTTEGAQDGEAIGHPLSRLFSSERTGP